MAFREKTAWLILFTFVIAYGVYFGVLGPKVGFGSDGLIDIIWTFGAVAVVQVVIIAIGASVLAILSPKEANAHADERDIAIERRGVTSAYYVLITGAILVGVVMPFSEPPWKIVNAALGAIVLAEFVHYGVVLFLYRRSAGG